MFDRLKPKIGCSSSITNRWTCLRSFNVQKLMFKFVWCSIKWCSNTFKKYFELEGTVYLENESYYQWNENEERNQRNPLFCKYWQAISRLTIPQKKHATCSQKSRSWFLWDMRNLNISSTLDRISQTYLDKVQKPMMFRKKGQARKASHELKAIKKEAWEYQS